VSAPAESNRERKIPMRMRTYIVAAALLVLGGGAFALAYGRGAPEGADPYAAHAAPDPHAAHAAPADPHAGHGAPAPDEEGVVRVAPEQARALGLQVVAAEMRDLGREIRTTGSVTYDETRLTTIAPRFAGFVERLYVDFTGQAVRAGQPLLEIYAPELLAAQEELLSALRMRRELAEGASPAAAARLDALVEASRSRLLLTGISAAQVRQVESSGRARRTLTLHAPGAGFVTERLVQSGQAVEAGAPLYRMADLSRVWVEADLYEQDLRFVRLGGEAKVEIAAYPGERFDGRVSYVYPEVRPEARTGRVRVELANPGGRIKPGMFATVSVRGAAAEREVTVPRDAVMHGGTHDMVFVEESTGVYRMRAVSVGGTEAGRTRILSGLAAGERVVARANFLLDAESRLLDGLDHGMDH
jgi:membrane fusion protein, copper/silver efflux system